MRVIVINDFDYVQGGASKVAIETANILYSSGIDVSYFSAVHKDENILKCKNISTKQIEMIEDRNRLRGMINNLYNFKAKRMLGLMLKEYDPKDTIVHVHGWTKALSSSIFDVLNKRGFKVVLTAHDYFSVCPNGGFFDYKKKHACMYNPMSKECLFCNCDSRNIYYKIYRLLRQFIQNNIVKMSDNLDYLLTISDFSEKILLKYFKPKLVQRIYNPTSIDSKPKKVDVSKNDYFIYVGRISKEKGVDKLCKAFSYSKQRLVIVGNGDELILLKERFLNNKNIQFLGWKKQDEVYSLMTRAKALVLPSLWYEGAPLVVFEAMSMGLPCIVSNQCSAVDFVKDGYNGRTFDPHDIDSVLNAIKFNDGDLEIYSNRIYNDYWTNPFDKNRYSKRLMEVYNNILNY